MGEVNSEQYQNDRRLHAAKIRDQSWVASLPKEKRVLMAARAAVRTIANFRGFLIDGTYKSKHLNDADLLLLRQTLFTSCTAYSLLSSNALEKIPTFGIDGRSPVIPTESDYTRSSALEKTLECIARSVWVTSDDEDFSSFWPDCFASAVSSSAYIANHENELEASMLDAKHENKALKLLNTPVWHDIILTELPLDIHNGLVSLFDLDPAWSFWSQFYQRMWLGNFSDWELAFEVLKIKEKHWEKGFQHIGEKIARIEARLRPEDLLLPEAKVQAANLLAKPEPAALAADGLAQLIEMAAMEYKREISNALPTELEPLENLPALLRNISLVLTSSAPATQKEKQLQTALRLAAKTVGDLNRRLAQSRLELETCRGDGHGRKLFADAFYEKAGERVAELLTSKVLWGGLASGTGFILGGGSAEALTTGLQECFQSVIQPEVQEALKPATKPKA